MGMFLNNPQITVLKFNLVSGKDRGLPAEAFLLSGSVATAVKNEVEEHKIELVIQGHQKDFL